MSGWYGWRGCRWGRQTRLAMRGTRMRWSCLRSARQVQHDFQITPANRPIVTQICRLPEGMPLGIELAATWVRVLSCSEIVAELVLHPGRLDGLPNREYPTRRVP